MILAKTIKGYGLGEAGEGRNITHQQKKLNESELHHFRDRFEIPISDAAVADASGLEVGQDVLIGSVTDSAGNVYPSPNAERVTVTGVDTAAKTFYWNANQPLEHYHLAGEHVIKSRTNIVGIIGIIITLLVIFAGKVRLPEMIRNAFGWFLGFVFLLVFLYLAVIFLIDGSRYAIILGIGALLAPGIAVFAWLRDRAAAKKLNL